MNNIIKSFKDVKCKKCDSNGFLIEKNKVVKCNCRIEYEKDLMLYDFLIKGNLLNENSIYSDFEIFKKYSFDDYIGNKENIDKLKKYVDNFDKIRTITTKDENGNEVVKTLPPFKNLHLLIYGNRGTQKSWTVRGMLSLLAQKNHSIYYITLKDLINVIMDSEREEEQKKELNKILNVDVLVIDECTASSVNFYASGYKQSSLVSPLKTRLEINRKSTIFISNDTPTEIREGQFGETIGDCIVRETKFGQMEFKDNYYEKMDKSDFEKQMNSIWD